MQLSIIVSNTLIGENYTWVSYKNGPKKKKKKKKWEHSNIRVISDTWKYDQLAHLHLKSILLEEIWTDIDN